MQMKSLRSYICSFLFMLILTTGVVHAQAPVAAFDSDEKTGCAGQSLFVQFEDQSTNNPTSWLWDFGDGTTSTQQNPIHRYDQEGAYTVTLRVTNADGSNQLRVEDFIVISPLPQIDFVQDETEGCPPLEVNFSFRNLNASPITAYQWTFTNGAFDTVANPVITFNEGENIGLVLTVTDINGCINTQTFNNVANVFNEGPDPTFTADQTGACQAPLTVNFNNTTDENGQTITYLWQFPGGTPNSHNGANPPAVTYDVTGSYDVTLISTTENGCRKDTTINGFVGVGDVTADFTLPSFTVCVGDSVNFENTSSGGLNEVTWDFGDGNTSNQISPVHFYDAEGTYTVTLSASNPDGCSDDTQREVTVIAPPQPAFTLDTPDVCEPPVRINFTNQSVNANQFTWNFGDGATSTEANPSHEYADVGRYNITLTATNGSGCSASITERTDITTGSPEANFVADNQDGCVPHTTTFQDLSTSINSEIVAWQWTFDGAGASPVTSNDTVPEITFTQEGIYAVELIVTDSKGCTDTLRRESVGRIGTPPVDFSMTVNDSTVCVNEPLQFTSIFDQNADTSDYRYYWDFEYEPGSFERMSTEQDPSHTYSDPDTFSVAFVIDNQGCAPDTFVKENWIVVSPPKAQFGADRDLVCELPGQVLLENQSEGPPDVYEWSLDGQLIGTDSIPPVVTINDRGTHEIKLVVRDTTTGCADSTFLPVNAGLVSADFNTPDRGGCKPYTATFENLSQNSVVFFWEFNAGRNSTSSEEEPTFMFNENGLYDVKLVATDEFGCSDSVTKQDYIRVLGPNINITADPRAGCPPLAVAFADSSSGIGFNPADPNVRWRWNFGDPASGAANVSTLQNPIHRFDTVGNYDITLTVTDNQGCSDSATFQEFIQVTDPVVDFTVSDTATCAGNVLEFTSLAEGVELRYEWDFGDSTFSKQENPTHVYKEPGLYPVSLTVTDINGCTDSLTITDYILVESIEADFLARIAGSGTPFSADTIAADCATPPLVVEFSNRSTGNNIVGFDWDFGDGIGISPLENPRYAYTSSGIFDVALTIEHEDGCIDRFVREEFVQIDGPTGDFSINNEGQCLGDTVAVEIISLKAVRIFVDPGDGTLIQRNLTGVLPNVPDTTEVKFVYNTPGEYEIAVSLFDANGCENTITGDTLRLFNFPVADFLADSIGCAPYTGTFLDITTVADTNFVPIVNWNWDFGGVDTSTLQIPTTTFPDTGTYPITLTVTDANGCTDDTTKNIRIVEPIQAAFVASDTFTCAPVAIQFTDTSFNSTASSWQWDFGDNTAINDGTDTTQNPIHQYTQNGVFDVTLIVGDELGCSDTLTRSEYIVLRGPDAQVRLDRDFGCAPADITFFGDSTTSDTILTSYSWCITTLSNGFTRCIPGPTGSDSINLEFPLAGNYEVELVATDILGCQDTSEAAPFTVDDRALPAPIELRSVSVLSDESTVVSFNPYPGNDFVDYAVYRFDGNTPIFLDNINDRLNTTFLDTFPGVDATENIYCYKVLAKNICDEYSSLDDTEEHCTVELATNPGTDQITLSWNPYVGWDVGTYRIYRAESYELSSLTLIGEVPGDQLFFVDTATFCTDSISYRIAAIDLSPNNEQSFSDISADAPEHEAPTEGFNIGNATVINNDAIEISWPAYTGYKPAEYLLERSENGRTWDTLAITNPDVLAFIDTTVDVEDLSYTYRISVLDSCGDRTPMGLIGKTILLDVNFALNSSDPVLNWSQYQAWPQGISSYELEVFNESTGRFELVDVLAPGLTTYTDRRTELDQPTYCYRIKAVEAGGLGSVSVSNEMCINFDPQVYAPSAFTPNDDGRNDVFQITVPNLTNAELKIYNRWGELLYRTLNIDQGWDGTYNGQTAQEGVYVYLITGTGVDGIQFSRSGTITLIR